MPKGVHRCPFWVALLVTFCLPQGLYTTFGRTEIVECRAGSQLYPLVRLWLCHVQGTSCFSASVRPVGRLIRTWGSTMRVARLCVCLEAGCAFGDGSNLIKHIYIVDP